MRLLPAFGSCYSIPTQDILGIGFAALLIHKSAFHAMHADCRNPYILLTSQSPSHCICLQQRLICAVYRDIGWLGSRVVSVLDSGAEGPGYSRSRDAVG